MGKYMSAHKFIQYTWVDVSVVSLGDCKEFLWFSWVYVSECEVYDCNWVYFGVFGSMWVYVSVFECMWMLWVYLSVVWTLQLFPEPHTEFCHHCSTSVQTHPPRFRIPARTVTVFEYIWVHVSVCDSIWVYLSVCEC